MNEREDVERFDPAVAAKHAQSHPKPNGVAPHHLRCDWVKGKKRCNLGENHSEAHNYDE